MNNYHLQSYGNEWALFKLGHVGTVSSIHIDTIHFKGNYPQNVQIEGAIISSGEDINNAKWKSMLPPQKVKKNYDCQLKFLNDNEAVHTAREICYSKIIARIGLGDEYSFLLKESESAKYTYTITLPYDNIIKDFNFQTSTHMVWLILRKEKCLLILNQIH